jgi:uncharacterized membrane protein
MKPDPSTLQRSLAKALSWETLSTLSTFGLAYLMFGCIGTCLAFAVVSFVMKLVLFYYHERAWHQIPFGKTN